MQVELVNVQTSDGVRLDGTIREAGARPQLGLDLVIFHHGLGGNFYQPSMTAALSDHFVAEGCSVLRVNSRGHDQIYSSPKGWLGSACEIVDDFRHDCLAWLDFAEASGYERIGLWGHSLGAVKTIHFLATENDPRVVNSIASSPPRFHYESFVAGEEGKARADSIARGQELIAAGNADELVKFNLDPVTWFTARSLVDKYGPDDRYDFFRHLPRVTVPLLLTVGGLEGGFRFQALQAEGPTLAAAQANLTFAAVDGADHSYLSRIPEVWSLARGWLDTVSPAPVG